MTPGKREEIRRSTHESDMFTIAITRVVSDGLTQLLMLQHAARRLNFCRRTPCLVNTAQPRVVSDVTHACSDGCGPDCGVVRPDTDIYTGGIYNRMQSTGLTAADRCQSSLHPLADRMAS